MTVEFLEKSVKMFIGWRYTAGPKHALNMDDIALWERYIEANEVRRIYQVSFCLDEIRPSNGQHIFFSLLESNTCVLTNK